MPKNKTKILRFEFTKKPREKQQLFTEGSNGICATTLNKKDHSKFYDAEGLTWIWIISDYLVCYYMRFPLKSAIFAISRSICPKEPEKKREMFFQVIA